MMMTYASASIGIGIEREGGGAVREGGGAVCEGGGSVSFGLAFAGRRRRALKRTYPINGAPIRRSLVDTAHPNPFLPRYYPSLSHRS